MFNGKSDILLLLKKKQDFPSVITLRDTLVMRAQESKKA